MRLTLTRTYRHNVDLGRLSPDRYLELLDDDGPALAAAAKDHLSERVPGCPEWDVAGLVAHTGSIHRWVTEIVRTRTRERMSRKGIQPPSEHAAMLEWYSEGVGALRAALVDAGPETVVWNWTGSPAPAAFWFRRMAQETAVHRWDAQSASGAPSPIPTDLAVDGLAELLDIFLPLSWGGGRPPDIGGSLHVHTTDAEGEWTVRPGDGRLEVETGHGKGDAAVRGPASAVLMALWGRPAWDDVEVFGDAGVVARWRELIRF